LSNLNDLLKAVSTTNADGTAKAVDTVDAIGSSMGLLADVSGVVGFVQLATSLVNTILGNDDQVTQMLNKLQQEIQILEASQKAEDVLERMRNLEQAIVGAATVLAQLRADVGQQPPVSNEYRLTQIGTCLAAVIDLTDMQGTDNKWRVVFNDQNYYSDGWNGVVAPQPDGDGLVFNYTYVLPIYLRSIYILLTAIGTLMPKDLETYNDVLRNSCIARLQMVHDTVLNNGIVVLRAPDSTEMWRAYDPNNTFLNSFVMYKSGPYYRSYPDGKYLAFSAWSGGELGADPYSVYGTTWPFQIYGAVERYAGNGSTANYPPMDVPPSGPPPSADWMEAVQGKLALRFTKMHKAAYATAGMPSVLQVANQLRAIVGDPPVPDPGLNSWSVLEIVKILGPQCRYGANWQHIPPGPKLILPSPTLRTLRAYLESVPPTCAGDGFATLQPYRPISLRQFLTA
jgi:hypothetical protein